MLELIYIDIDGRNILYYPIKLNYLDILKLILEKNQNIIGLSILDTQDEFGLTCSHYCIILNNLEALKILMNYNTNLYIKSNNGFDTILLAIKYKRKDIIKYLLSLNININTTTSNGFNSLNLAILYELNEISEILLNSNINLNNVDKENGMAAIHQICKNGSFDLFDIIINKNIDFNTPDLLGNTPLHYTIIESNFDLSFKLIDKIDNFNIYNYQGDTVLHLCLINKNTPVELIEILIKNSKINLQNNDGETAMHLLAYTDLFKYEKILEKKEINIFINNKKQKNVLQVFKSQNSTDIDRFINLIVNSYYNSLKKHSNKSLIKKWELLCSKKRRRLSK